MLLVSHDRVFLDRVVTSTVAFEGNGRVVEYVGGYEDYLRQRTPASPAAPASPKPPRGEGGPRQSSVANRPSPMSRSRPRKLSYKEQLELDALPARIAALEEEQARLREDAAAPEFYKSPAGRIASVLARIETVGHDVEALLARWVELEEIRKVR